MRYVRIVVPAPPDQDDPLTCAALTHTEEHPELEGYDLAPAWTDDYHDSVTLRIPVLDVVAAAVARSMTYELASEPPLAATTVVLVRGDAVCRCLATIAEADDSVGGGAYEYRGVTDDGRWCVRVRPLGLI